MSDFVRDIIISEIGSVKLALDSAREHVERDTIRLKHSSKSVVTLQNQLDELVAFAKRNGWK